MTLLPQRNNVTCYVSRNLINCCTILESHLKRLCVSACDLEKSFSCGSTVEITSTWPFNWIEVTNATRQMQRYHVRLRGNHKCPIERHEYQWPWVTWKVTVAVLNLYNSHSLGNIGLVHIKYNVFKHDLIQLKGHVLVISTVLPQLKDFWRSQALTYIDW